MPDRSAVLCALLLANVKNKTMVNQVMVGMVIRFHSLRSAQNQPLEDPGLGYFSIGANHVGGTSSFDRFDRLAI